ncbi:MAG: hypothetical protein JWO36_1168 [Myxococcales bacterium]|nr:hypothetical protein [Myxococcales bacterium]
MELGAADLSCLGTPANDPATTVAVTLNAELKDFQSGNPVTPGTVVAFKGNDASMIFDTKTVDGNGNVTFTVPVGVQRFGYKMTGDFMPTFLLNQTVKPDVAVQPTCGSPPCKAKIQSVSNSTAAVLPALIGDTRTPGTGVIAGALRDCMGHEVSNYIATVSSAKGTATPLMGASAYYFSASVGLPVHHSQQESASGDGLFMAIQLPATATAYVQMWGYKTDSDMAADQLSLIAELQVPVLADTVITGSYEPLRQ